MKMTIALLTLALAAGAQAQGARFDFEGKADGYVPAGPSVAYDPALGHGWEDGSRFSVKLPEGNYRVTMVLGGKAASETTVKAEGRRLMLEAVKTDPRRPKTLSFVVNVRTGVLPPPQTNAPGGTAVRLKPSEIGSATWDDKLTLEFLGERAHVARVEIAPAKVPTIFLAGDSTVTDQRAEPAASWGQMLPRFLDGEVAVANHAESGETLKSFLTAYRFDKLLSQIGPGDYLLIQFGHNDQKAQWPQTYVEAETTYRAYLRAYVAEARRRGAEPVLVTSPERRNFDATGKIVPSLGGYPEAVRAVAKEENVPLVDLTPMTIAFYEALGPERSPLAFNDGGKDKTHHNNYGAYVLARMIAARLATAVPELSRHVLPEAQSADPARPPAPERFSLAPSVLHSNRRPEGN